MFKPICTRILITSLLLLSIAPVYSEEILLGKDENWFSIEHHNRTSVRKTLSGSTRLTLADDEYIVDDNTEMLLHFDRGFADSSENYSIKTNSGVSTSTAVVKRGQGAAVFAGNGERLELIPDKTTVFAAENSVSDFTIEFWLNPARLAEGETVLKWQSAIETQEELLQQEILCAVTGRKLFWEFNNFFFSSDLSGTNITLDSQKTIIPNRWHHHLVRYKRKTGLLEYLIDGIPEAVTYVSRDGDETEEIYTPLIGTVKPSSFILGMGFTGFIDELRISNSFVTDPALKRYSLHSGTAVTGLIDLKYYDSRILTITDKVNLPGKTDINYYYRISNSYFALDSETPSWKQLFSDEILPPDTTGRYLQIMAELFPDGTGEFSPELSEIAITYNKNLPPLPPGFLSAEPGDGYIRLKWQRVNDADIAGYKIYYGNAPGNYFGTSEEGESPIEAGGSVSYQINGLENGKLYYFAITSYDNAEIPQESVFSREVSIRPSAIFRNSE